MLISKLPIVSKIFMYLLLFGFLIFLYVFELKVLLVLVSAFSLILGLMDWNDARLRRFFSYGLKFGDNEIKEIDLQDKVIDLEVVLKLGVRLNALLCKLQTEYLLYLGKSASINQKARLLDLYREIEVILESLNKYFWENSGSVDFKTEEGRVMYFIYIAAFIYIYDAGSRLSASTTFVVNLLSSEFENFNSLMRTLSFPSTQVFWRSGLYVLNGLNFFTKKINKAKKKFINSMKYSLGVSKFPWWSSIKYYYSLLVLFKQKRWVPLFRSFLLFINKQKIRNGEMAMSKANVDHVLSVIEPGDIIIARRAVSMTSLVIPGYWTHGAMYVGNNQQLRSFFGSKADGLIRKIHNINFLSDESYVIEAIENGVTLSGSVKGLRADSLVVFKPKLKKKDRLKALEFALDNLSKEYDYGLDFFSETSFICSELVYKAYSDLDTGVQKLGFRPRSVVGLVLTFTPQDLYEACFNSLNEGIELGICLKHDFNYKKVREYLELK